MKKTTFFTLLLLITVANVNAAPIGQAPAGEAYVVQADDWLSKIAEKFYGDMFAYPTIVEATNAKAAEDETFAPIENPDIIEVGQKLWIPAAGVSSFQTEEMSPPETEVIHYIPAIPSKTEEGSCWTSSIAASGSPYAWRCMVENLIYDPCLTAADGQTIVCGIPDEEFGLKLTEPLPAPEIQNNPVRPWLFELENGASCSPFTGTLPPIEEIAPYGCDDESVILGELQEGPVWYARRAILVPNESGPLPFKVGEETRVPILKVWLPGEPVATNN